MQQTRVNWAEHLTDDDLSAAYEAQEAASRLEQMAQSDAELPSSEE
jgi:hypothetical protein